MRLVGCQEHDVVPGDIRHVPGQDEHQRGRQANGQCAEQELLHGVLSGYGQYAEQELLHGVDPNNLPMCATPARLAVHGLQPSTFMDNPASIRRSA